MKNEQNIKLVKPDESAFPDIEVTYHYQRKDGSAMDKVESAPRKRSAFFRSFTDSASKVTLLITIIIACVVIFFTKYLR